jgi:hypothetical protein
MSDKKRPTRLLPFRMRRASHAADYACDARELSADAGEFSEDAELSTLLRAWDAPEPSARSREHLLSEFRAGVVRAPFWRRALSAELRVPLPVAACAALALLASLFTLAARTQTPAQTAATTTAHNATADVRVADAAPEVKIVEVPIERERVVTRVVYVERNAPRAEAQMLTTTQQPASTERIRTTRGVVRSNSNSEAASRQAAVETGAQSATEPTSYFTRVDMADFQPADEMKIRIVKRGKTDEK